MSGDGKRTVVDLVNASSTVVVAVATVVLAWLNWKYLEISEGMLKQSAETIELTKQALDVDRRQAEYEFRPYLEISLVKWDAGGDAELALSNVGRGAAVQVRFEYDHTKWLDTEKIQGAVTIAPGQEPHFYTRYPFYPLRSGETEFRIHYLDVAGTHEFWDKWRLGYESNGRIFVDHVYSTPFAMKPTPAEEYVVNRGPSPSPKRP